MLLKSMRQLQINKNTGGVKAGYNILIWQRDCA